MSTPPAAGSARYATSETGWRACGPRRRWMWRGHQEEQVVERASSTCPTVAVRDLADPERAVASHARSGGGSQSTRQQPEEVLAAALDWIRCAPMPLLQFVVGQVGCEVDASWPAPVLQLHAATPYHIRLILRAGSACIGKLFTTTTMRHMILKMKCSSELLRAAGGLPVATAWPRCA